MTTRLTDKAFARDLVRAALSNRTVLGGLDPTKFVPERIVDTISGKPKSVWLYDGQVVYETDPCFDDLQLVRVLEYR